nr:hypothetical protein CFP56_12044 [Quercus suber]
MLVVGSVIIGRREEEKVDDVGAAARAEPTVTVQLQKDSRDQPGTPLAGAQTTNADDLKDSSDSKLSRRRKQPPKQSLSDDES